MERKNFEKLVEEALEEIPQKFKKHLQNIAVIVEARPSRETAEQLGHSPFDTVFGVYHGVPLKHRGPFYGNIPPDVITIFQESIERRCPTEKQIKEKVREVVFHEIGHYFGLSDKDLKDIEKKIK
ncbi:metallopeptidase family protein [bacterium]|nr:metallopeptidase family protein [bacterium]